MAPSEQSAMVDGALSPKTGGTKAVTIAEPGVESANNPPPFLADTGRSSSLAASSTPKQHRAKMGRTVSGRSNVQKSTPIIHPITSQSSLGSSFTQAGNSMAARQENTALSHGHHDSSGGLVTKVLEWLQAERLQRARHKSQSKRLPYPISTNVLPASEGMQGTDVLGSAHERSRSPSDASEGAQALDKLERILTDHMVLETDKKSTPAHERPTSYFPSRRTSSMRKLRKRSNAVSSDSEYQDGDVLIPTADVVLDNSKTLAYTGGATESENDISGKGKGSAKDKEGWVEFKNEIVRLAHTLRLKGWRRIPLNRGADIEVERLSGALTNAVYVVSPPKHLPETPSDHRGSTASLSPKKPPQKLLLRIYGPQVEHLIDRENELQILRRLARKKIGPRLLGTFLNGRFEEFFYARTLTARDLRIPETSKQIAKRMRELHDGIELLEEEREAGAFVWRNWDKWVERCEEVISWIDGQVLPGQQRVNGSRSEGLKQRGLICGVQWSVFRQTVERYRQWLIAQYGGTAGIRQHLVFAHNDTQYGNLLRLKPSGESPLLLPANEHKQLVVIDFEYASANVPGLEFANHFTEWCYNYHDPEKPYALNIGHYPTPEEQRRFIKAYVQHRPEYHLRASVTPTTAASPGPSSSISSFMLDSRAPPAQMVEEEHRMAEATEAEIRRLMHEARIWRVANSAQWVAWGVVQAKVPGMDEASLRQTTAKVDLDDAPGQNPERGLDQAEAAGISPDISSPDKTRAVQGARDKRPEGLVAEALRDGNELPHEDDEEEFDYLGYAQERAMFFWGDLISLGIVQKHELSADLLQKIKVVEY